MTDCIASSNIIHPVTSRWPKTEAETCRQFEIKQITKLSCDLLKIHILSLYIHTTEIAHLKIILSSTCFGSESLSWR
jgi:hypothetical protein